MNRDQRRSSIVLRAARSFGDPASLEPGTFPPEPTGATVATGLPGGSTRIARHPRRLDRPHGLIPRTSDVEDLGLEPGHPHHRLVELGGPGGAVELAVPEGEDAAVGGHEPVAVAGPGGCHADDRLVQGGGARRAEELGVAEAEYSAVGGHEPVAVARWRGRRPHDGLVEDGAALGSEELGVPEAEDSAVRGYEPVARGTRPAGGSGRRRGRRGGRRRRTLNLAHPAVERVTDKEVARARQRQPGGAVELR